MTWFSKKRNMPKLKLELKQKKIEEMRSNFVKTF